MRNLRYAETSILFGIFAALVLAITPSLAVAGGGGFGSEPGDQCFEGNRKFVPPPYIGDVVVEYNEDDGTLSFFGSVAQVGNSACTGSIDHAIPTTMQPGELQALTGPAIMGTCLENLCDLHTGDCYFDCMQRGGFVEVVGVANMKAISPTSRSATFIVMEVIEK
jgi:hypothetical protein